MPSPSASATAMPAAMNRKERARVVFSGSCSGSGRCCAAPAAAGRSKQPPLRHAVGTVVVGERGEERGLAIVCEGAVVVSDEDDALAGLQEFDDAGERIQPAGEQ